MDPLYSTRLVMAGWLFAAVFFGGLWETNSTAWSNLTRLLLSSDTTVLAVALGALVGLGGPPAVGYLFERAVLGLSYLRGGDAVYPKAEHFVDAFPAELKADLKARYQALINSNQQAAIFHVFFYSYAAGNYLEWARRRRTHQYASAAGALAVFSALVLSSIISLALPPATTVLAVMACLVLVLHAYRENRVHNESVAAWIDTMGPIAIAEFVSKLRAATAAPGHQRGAQDS